MVKIVAHILLLTIGADFFNGLCRIKLTSAKCNPNAIPGKVSAITLIHNICSDDIGLIPRIIIPNINETNPDKLVINNKTIIRLMLSIIERPKLTALIIVAKLSSINIISLDAFETSVPVIPIAHPMSAAFSAGASLTPSPVILTTLSWCCQALTIRILSVGETRA